MSGRYFDYFEGEHREFFGGRDSRDDGIIAEELEKITISGGQYLRYALLRSEGELTTWHSLNARPIIGYEVAAA